MSNKLEDFIRKNKTSFDEHEPSAALWKRLEKQLDTGKEPIHTRVVKFSWVKWAAAAVIILAVGLISLTYWNKPAKNIGLADAGNNEPVSQTAKQKPADDSIEEAPLMASMQEEHTGKPNGRNLQDEKQNNEPVLDNNETKEELFHYTRLIEIKQKQIESLKTKSPELYTQFADDLKKLEISYTNLKTKLETGLNSEQVLEAMIQNLKMQAGLLNKQLEITRKLNHNDHDDENPLNTI